MINTNTNVGSIYEPGQSAQAVGVEQRGYTPEQDVSRAVRRDSVSLKLSYQTVIVRVPVQGPTIKRVVE